MPGPVEIQNLRETFAVFDRDGDGHIPGRELPLVIRALGVNPTDDEIFTKLEGKDDALINEKEFIDLAGGFIEGKDPEANLLASLKILDRDNNGKISASELKNVMITLGEVLTTQEVEALIQLGDPNNTGVIEYPRLVRILTGKE